MGTVIAAFYLQEVNEPMKLMCNICPTCPPKLPALFVTYLFSLCLQSCARSLHIYQLNVSSSQVASHVFIVFFIVFCILFLLLKALFFTRKPDRSVSQNTIIKLNNEKKKIKKNNVITYLFAFYRIFMFGALKIPIALLFLVCLLYCKKILPFVEQC